MHKLWWNVWVHGRWMSMNKFELTISKLNLHISGGESN